MMSPRPAANHREGGRDGRCGHDRQERPGPDMGDLGEHHRARGSPHRKVTGPCRTARPYRPCSPQERAQPLPRDRINHPPLGLQEAGESATGWSVAPSLDRPTDRVPKRRRHNMRTTKLISAALVAGALMAPATASAARLHPNAHRHALGGPCVLSEVAEPRTITSGESAQVY